MNRAGAGDVLLNRWITRIGNFSRAGDSDFQRLSDRDFRVARACGGDFGCPGLEAACAQLAGPGHISQEFIDVSIERNMGCAATFKSELGSGELFCSKSYGAADSCTCPCWTGDNDLDSVCWPDLIVRAQMQSVPRDVARDVRKKVFVRRDAESRGPVLPFDLECSTGVDLGKGTNRSIFSFDMAVASNSRPSASNGQGHACSQKYKGNLLHGNMISLVTMQRRGALDSREIGVS